MIFSSSEEIHTIIKKVLNKHRIDNKLLHKGMFTLKSFSSLVKFSNSNNNETKLEVRKHLGDEICISSHLISCLTYLAFSIADNIDEKYLFPESWYTSKYNINLLFNNNVIQIVNYSLSILILIESGLDNPARSLLRNVLELVWQTLLIYSDEETLISNHEGFLNEKTTETWYSLFAKGKNYKKLSEFEKHLGFSNIISDELKKQRKENIEFLSNAVHHSSLATNAGSYVSGFNETDILNFALLGTPSKASNFTVNTLNDELIYFTMIFFKLFEERYDLKDAKKNQKMYYSMVHKEIALELYQFKNDLYKSGSAM